MTNSSNLVIDIEANDTLLSEITTVHCVALLHIEDTSNNPLLLLNEDLYKLKVYVNFNIHDSLLIGHNLYGYDIPVLQKFGLLKQPKAVYDTYLMSQLLFPDLYEYDDINIRNKKYVLPDKRLWGSHSLKAWGWRLGRHKGEYVGDFKSYTEDMGEYCKQDVLVTKALYEFLRREELTRNCLSEEALNIENTIAPILARQQHHGVLFDLEKAHGLYANLLEEKLIAKQELQEVFKPRYISLGEFTPQRNDSKFHYKKGCTFTKIELEEFNPGSTKQIVDRLKKEFNWVPVEFTKVGNPKMDEEVIADLPYPEVAPLKKYSIIKQRLGQLNDGKNGLIKCVKVDHRIHGAIRQNGAVTSRMAHFSPNMNIPTNENLYGKEMRELFTVPESKIIVGVDADSLELRCLGGYLHSIDNGLFIESLLKGDKEKGTDNHSLTAKALGTDRETAKTWTYANLYGGGDVKRGKIIIESGIDPEQYLPDKGQKVVDFIAYCNRINMAINTEKEALYGAVGKHSLELYGAKMPYLGILVKRIKSTIRSKNYLIGLDGRKLPIRHTHAALNSLLQSCGAILMKKALQIADNDLQLELIAGKDYEFILNVHDEWQLEVTKGYEDRVAEICKNAIKKAGEYFNFPCPMAGNAKIGKTWADSH